MFSEILSAMLDASTYDLQEDLQFLLDYIELPDVRSTLSDDEYFLLHSFEIEKS